MDWRGRAHEREVKLQLFGAPRNPLRGLAWSSARSRGKVATFQRPVQPFAWIGVVERAIARYSCNFSAPRATLCVDWRGRARERMVKLQFFATFRRPVQPFAWMGVVERANAR